MNIVSLSPTVTELLLYLDVTTGLAGVTPECLLPPEVAHIQRINDSQQLQALHPQIIIVESTSALTRSSETWATVPRIITAKFQTLELMYQTIAEIGKVCGVSEKASQLINRIKAQSMDWADNFYQRTKNKKVSVLSSVNPLTIAGFMVPDLVKLCSADPQHHLIGEPDAPTSWTEIHKFRPDVIIVAPRNYSLKESTACFKNLEKEKLWEEIPAVKRGEVIFMDGVSLYAPGPRILDAIAILFSAIAGLESGYITPRDSFHRLRFLELNRHKI